MNLFHRALFCAALTLTASLRAADLSDGFTEHIHDLAGATRGSPVRLKGNETAVTKAGFTPPVEILVEAKTNSIDLNMAFGDMTIGLNDGHQPKTGPKALHVKAKGINGGPKDKGAIPTNKYVILRWAIAKDHISFSVDGEERFEHKYDFAKSGASPVTVSTGGKAEVWVKSIKTRPLADGAK